MIPYSVKMPDMSRNVALAGQTVSSRGMNVTYDENGYAVKATNYGHKFFAQTSKGIRAPSKEAVLASGSRTGYDGPVEDQMHFSDHEFARAVDLRRQVAEGKLSDKEANDLIEEIRRTYGYSFGASGTQYAAAILPDRQPDDVVMAQIASAKAQAASVQSAAPRRENSETEHLRSSYQEQLREQQQRQTIHGELEELRVKDVVRAGGKGKASEILLDLMDEDENEDD